MSIRWDSRNKRWRFEFDRRLPTGRHTALADYFRRAGREPKLTSTTTRSRAGSTPLRLVSNDHSA